MSPLLWIEVVLGAGATLLAIPVLVFCAEVLLALLPRRREALSPARPRLVVLMPAHDEEAGIGETLAALQNHLGPEDRVLVVADNCTDRTAEVAREAGAQVTLRDDPTRLGKGHALAHGVAALADDPPEVLVVLDADCRFEPGALELLSQTAAGSGRPVQARCDLVLAQPGPAQAVSLLAYRVRNVVRAAGLSRIGAPVPLGGTGMALPWSLTPQLTAEDSLVEDLELTVRLTLAGAAPIACLDARLSTPAPQSAAGTLSQRRRWERGRLGAFPRASLRLLAGFFRGRWAALPLLLDLCVPPLALLSLALLALLAASGGLAGSGGLWRPLALAGTETSLLVGAVLLAWVTHARDLPFWALASAPFYVLWKLPIYLGRAGGWSRGERSAKRS